MLHVPAGRACYGRSCCGMLHAGHCCMRDWLLCQVHRLCWLVLRPLLISSNLLIQLDYVRCSAAPSAARVSVSGVVWHGSKVLVRPGNLSAGWWLQGLTCMHAQRLSLHCCQCSRMLQLTAAKLSGWLSFAWHTNNATRCRQFCFRVFVMRCVVNRCTQLMLCCSMKNHLLRQAWVHWQWHMLLLTVLWLPAM